MDQKDIIKSQFNKQAEKFSNWSVTRNEEYLQGHFDFFGIAPEDNLLDVACGSGEFSIYCAKRIKNVFGVDISNKMIELARNQASENNLNNIKFECSDVEHLPTEDNGFSIVVCKSAFHHFLDYDMVFDEMIRCCTEGGRIGIQDIVSYDDKHINDYFEKIERKIDISHNETLSKVQFLNLFDKYGIKLLKICEIDIELNFNEYVNHAIQSKINLKRIDHLLNHGLNNQDISKYFTTIDGQLYFKRNVLLMLGEK